MLEQSVSSPVGQRYSRWWAAYTGTGTVYLPLVMADSGHQCGNGPVSYYSIYKGYLDAELARPAGAELAVHASRVGNHYSVSVELVNRSGVTLSTANGAAVHVIVYEDIKAGVTSRMVRDAVYTSISSPIADSGRASFVLDTNDLSPVDWAKVHVLALADYRPGGTTGAYDMLQAAFAGAARRSAGDFNGDSTSDILWRHATRGDVWLWPMDGATKTAESYVRTVGEGGWAIRGLGDQNGDGKADVLWRHGPTGMLYLWTMNGKTIVTETYVATVDPAYDIVGTGDYNGDGKSDVLWRQVTNGELWVWLMDGATPLSVRYVETVDPGYVVQGSGDLNGDGKADIVWHHGTRGEVWVWLMNGTAKLSETWAGTVPDVGYQIAGVADHTAEGNADILWHHATRGEVWLWPMAGATRLSETKVATVPDTGYRIVGTGDYDGDGKADILWHHATRG